MVLISLKRCKMVGNGLGAMVKRKMKSGSKKEYLYPFKIQMNQCCFLDQEWARHVLPLHAYARHGHGNRHVIHLVTIELASEMTQAHVIHVITCITRPIT